MYAVDGTNIELTRGDTFAAVIEITKDGETYTPGAGDVIRFAMKHRYTDRNCVVEKVIDNESLLLRIEPSETKNVCGNEFVYDIEITFANGDVDTFIKGTLQLTPEVK